MKDRSRLLSVLAERYVVERFRRDELRPASATYYRSTLNNFVRAVGDRDAASLKQRHIEEWLGRDHVAPSTRRNTLSILKTWLKWLVQNDVIKKDPSVRIKGPRQPRFVPRAVKPADVDAVLSVCPDARSRLIVLLMAQEGLRCGEVSRLQLGEVDFNERLILVNGKGGHQRVLPLTLETWAGLRAYLTEHPATSGPLVRSYAKPGKALSPGYIGDRVRRLMVECGVKITAKDGRSAHALRHTAATDMLRAGAHVRDVQNVLGHQSLQTTQRYLPLVVNDLREAMAGRTYRGAADAVSGLDVPGR